MVEGLETSLICGKIFCRSKNCQNMKLTRRSCLSCFASAFDLNRQMDAASRHMRDKYPYSITVKRGTRCMREQVAESVWGEGGCDNRSNSWHQPCDGGSPGRCRPTLLRKPAPYHAALPRNVISKKVQDYGSAAELCHGM